MTTRARLGASARGTPRVPPPETGLPDGPAASLTDLAGGTALPLLTFVSVPWDTQRFFDPTAFAHTPPSPLIVVLNSGRYQIGFDVTPTMTAGGAAVGARTTVAHALLVNGAIVPGTIVFSYHRSSVDGTDTATLVPIQLVLAAGDIVSVISVKLTSAVSTISLFGGGSNLTLEQES